MKKAPFALPGDFLGRFGYTGNRRFIALYWEQCGDEAAFNDGRTNAVGCSDNWLFLRWKRQPEMQAWLKATGLFLGASDADATHMLVVDAQERAVYGGSRAECLLAVSLQEVNEAEVSF